MGVRGHPLFPLYARGLNSDDSTYQSNRFLFNLMNNANSTQSLNVDINSPTPETVFTGMTKYLLLRLNRKYKQQREQ